MGRFQHLKITLEGNSSLGPEQGDESGEAAATPPPGPLIGGWGHPTEETLKLLVHTPAYQAVCQREPREQPSWPECQLPSSDVLPGRLSGRVCCVPVCCGGWEWRHGTGVCLLKLQLDSRILSLKEAGYVCGGPESTLSQTSPLIRKQKAFLWRRLSREPRGGGYPEPGWRILWRRGCLASFHSSQAECCCQWTACSGVRV